MLRNLEVGSRVDAGLINQLTAGLTTSVLLPGRVSDGDNSERDELGMN